MTFHDEVERQDQSVSEVAEKRQARIVEVVLGFSLAANLIVGFNLVKEFEERNSGTALRVCEQSSEIKRLVRLIIFALPAIAWSSI